MKMMLTFVCALLVLTAGAPVKESGYGVGDIAADFKLKNIDGKLVSLADFTSAKGFIVIFDCNTCPVSKAYNARIVALSKKYTAQGFQVILINPNDPGVSPGDSYDKMKDYARKKGYDFPYLVDETQSVARAFGATNTPHTFVLTKDRKVAYIGAIDDSKDEGAVSKKYVEEAVDALLAGREVPRSSTKAVGCTIKWKNA